MAEWFCFCKDGAVDGAKGVDAGGGLLIRVLHFSPKVATSGRMVEHLSAACERCTASFTRSPSECWLTATQQTVLAFISGLWAGSSLNQGFLPIFVTNFCAIGNDFDSKIFAY